MTVVEINRKFKPLKPHYPELPFTPAMLAQKPDDYLLLPREVASLFGVKNVRTVSRWSEEGKLNAILTPGGQHRFRADGVRKVHKKILDAGDSIEDVDAAA